MPDQYPLDLGAVLTLIVHTPQRVDRAAHMREQVYLANLRRAEFVLAEPVVNFRASGALTFGGVFSRLALQEPFQPALILEDDATVAPEYSTKLVIPRDADAVYLGVSVCSLVEQSDDSRWGACVSQTAWPHLVRVHNMCSMHAVLVCSRRFALSCANACAYCAGLLAANETDVVWDVAFARRQATMNVYALVTPFFFQSASVGGQEQYTRVTLSGDNICAYAPPQTEPARWRYLRSPAQDFDA